MKKSLNLAIVVLAIAIPFGIPAALAIAAWRRRKIEIAIAEHDVVDLIEDPSGTDLVAGMRGTVLSVYAGGEAFAVEFSSEATGSTSCVETIPREMLRQAWTQRKAA